MPLSLLGYTVYVYGLHLYASKWCVIIPLFSILCTCSLLSILANLFFYIAILLQANAQSVSVLEGQSVTLQCVPTPDTLVVQWRFNGKDLFESDKITFSPSNLNQTLHIRDPGVENMGNYSCYVVNYQEVIETITLEVVQGVYVCSVEKSVRHSQVPNQDFFATCNCYADGQLLHRICSNPV